MIQASFNDTLRYQNKDDPATLVADLEELGRRSEAARSRRTVLIVVLVFWLITALFVTIATAGAGLVVAIPFGVVGAIVFGIWIYRTSRMILDERRRKLARGVVRHLGCDIPPQGKLEIDVDFNDYNSESYRTGAGKHNNYDTSDYRQPWLIVRGKLADGASIELTTDLVARRKERSKTKGRKKVKEDLCEHVSLTVSGATLPPAAPERWPNLVRTQPMPKGAYLHRARVQKDRLFVEVRTHRQVRVTNKGSVISGQDIENALASRHTLLVPVLAAYQALHACRKSC